MKRTITAKDEKTVEELISRNIPGISKAAIGALFKKGEIRLNGVKCARNLDVKTGDTVSVFVPLKYLSPVDVPIIYSDENIVIVNKPPFMDVENNLLSYIKPSFPTALAVHRLDRNTTGIVVFALNKNAYAELIRAFKERLTDKHYYALVGGKCGLKGNYEAYLTKDSENSQVKIYANEVRGSKKIITRFEVKQAFEDKTLLDVKLITGRTHQIRAHLSFLGFPIIGDNRYGDNRYGSNNGSHGEGNSGKHCGNSGNSGNKSIRLAAYKIAFKGLSTPLEYLNGKEFKIDVNIID